jgi:hypothetical protein
MVRTKHLQKRERERERWRDAEILIYLKEQNTCYLLPQQVQAASLQKLNDLKAKATSSSRKKRGTP